MLGVTDTLPSASPVTVNGGILDIGANTNTIASLNLINGSVIGTTGSLTSAVFAAQSGTISATLSGSGALTKTTGGTLNLSGVQTFTGALSIEAGRVNMNTTSMGAAINVIGGTLSGTGSAGGFLSMASGTSLALAGGLNTAGITTNGVSFVGPVSVVFDSDPDGGVTYDVITYGAGGVTGFGNLSIAGYRSAGLTDTGTKITYSLVNGIRTWNTTNGTWTTGGTGTNFTEGDQKFFNGDTVIFGDIANDSVVTLTGALRPASVTVNNSANTYTFSGGTLAGSTSLTKSGSGTLVLTGANSHTGVTTISGGVLSVSTLGNGGVAGNLGAASNASSNLVLNGGTLRYTGATASSDRGFTLQSGGGTIDVASADLTLSGVATGPGALTKTGAGTLILTGANAFTGGTTITTGTLALGSGGTLGAGAVNNNATLAFTGGDATFANTITGTGAVVQSGSGVTTLTGANNYTGGTTISTGTLALGTGGTLGSGAVNNNATLAFTGGDATFANVITGTGAVMQSGSGVTTLTGANAYTGGTTITTGTLALGTGGSLGSGAVNNNATLAFTGGDATFANTITGTGAVVQSGSGVTTLTGANAFTGGTTITTGTLALGTDSAVGSGTVTLSGGTLGASGGARTIANAITVSADSSIVGTDALVLSGPVQSNAVLTVANSGVTTISGPLTGSGSVVHSGAGRLSLETPGDFMLATPISGAGTFELAGSGITTLASGSVLNTAQTVVASGRTLDLGTDSARAQLTALTIRSGATLQGQGTVSSLTNDGVFSPGNSPGIVIVTGDFTNTGTLHIEIAGTGLAGAPDGHDLIVVGGIANLGGQLEIDYTGGIIPGNHTYRFITATTVNGTFASTLVTPTLPTDLLGSVVVDAAGVSFVTFQNLISIPGVPAFGALTALAVEEGRGASELMRTRLDSQRRLGGQFVDRPWAAYANVTGTDTNTDAGASNFNRFYMGGRGGLERVVGDGMTVGVNLGYDRGRASLHDNGGKITQDHVGAALYASHPLFDSRSFVYLGAFGGVSSYETERNSVGGTSKGDTDGWDAGATALLGYDFPVSEDVSITPYAGLTYTYARFDSFRESGAGALDLAMDGGHYNSLRSKLGFDVDWKMPVDAAKLSLGAGLAWEHELLDDTASLKGGFATAGAGRFDGEAPTLSRDLLSVGPQMTIAFGDGNQVRLGYRYQYGFGDETGHRVDLTFSRRF